MLLGRSRGELARLVPDLAVLSPDVAPPTRSDPETERYRMFDAVVDWLATSSEERPILLVLDDVHWAGRPTLLLLNHIVRSERPMRVLVVGTYRDTDRRAGPPVGRHARGLPPPRSSRALLVARSHHRGRRRPLPGERRVRTRPRRNRARARGSRRDRRQSVLHRGGAAPPRGDGCVVPARRPMGRSTCRSTASASPRACATSSADASDGSAR